MNYRLFLAFALFVVAPVSSRAADLYLTPSGAGARTGASWDDALAQVSLNKAVNELLQPGEVLHLGGGEYLDAELTISAGGTAGKPKSIVGEDRGTGPAIFKSVWTVDEPTRGRTAVRIAPGVSHVAVRNLQIQGYVFGVQAGPTPEHAPRAGLEFSHVDVDHIRHGYYMSDCDDLTLSHCIVKRYSKHGIRLEQGCDRVRFSSCHADCSEGDTDWEKKTELFPFGFIVNDGGPPNTEIRFEDCLSANNLMPLQSTKYKNGDGFVIEANTRDVAMTRCRALRNQDGGYDLKVPDVVLKDCVAIGNSRNIRIWSTGTLDNCFTGWAKTGIWTNGGPLTVRRTTFHELTNSAVGTDDKATEPVTVIDGLITKTALPHKKTSHGQAVFTDTVIATHDDDPQYVMPDPHWNGLGNAMDSRAYPSKGYRAPVESK